MSVSKPLVGDLFVILFMADNFIVYDVSFDIDEDFF